MAPITVNSAQRSGVICDTAQGVISALRCTEFSLLERTKICCVHGLCPVFSCWAWHYSHLTDEIKAKSGAPPPRRWQERQSYHRPTSVQFQNLWLFSMLGSPV
jgi:hypothetical protein